MRSLRVQYFLAYALMGALIPLLPVWLAAEGISRTQIGYIIGAASLAVVITPVLVTLLADARIDARRIMAVLFLVGAGTLLLLAGPAAGFWPILLIFSIHNLAYIPMLPLQDAIYFAVRRQRHAEGKPTPAFHFIRVWGSIGFIVPTLVLFVMLRNGWPVSIILPVSAAIALLGLMNTWLLPDPRIRLEPKPEEALPPASRLPTFSALKAMSEPHVLVFCVGMALVHMASAVYYGFYPIYLTDLMGIERQWIGLISSLGVAVEIVFMLSFGWLIRRLGLKWVVALGIIAIGGRLLLLAAAPHLYVAVGVQVAHGLGVLVLHVAPPLFLDRHAGDDFRSSMQGLYTMIVVGLSRIIGSIWAGYLVEWNLRGAFGWGAALCAAAAVLFIFAFHERRREPRGFEVIVKAAKP